MSPKTPKLALVLLATSAFGVAAFDVAADRIAHNTLQRIVDAHPGLKIARMDTSPWAGRVTLYGVEAAAGPTRVSIGTLRLPMARLRLDLIGSAVASPFDDAPTKPDATPAPEAPAAPAPAAPAPDSGSASAEDVVIKADTTIFHIKRIDLAGTSLSNADLAAMLDPKSPESLSDRLKKLTAASIVIPELTADDVVTNYEQHWTERQILLVNVVAGRVATGSAAGVSIAIKDATHASNGTLGAIETSGLDLVQLIRVFSDRRTDDAEPFVPLMDALTIGGGQFNDVEKTSTFSFGTIKETGFKGRPMKVDPAQANGEDGEKSKQLADDIFRSFSVASFDAANFVVQNEKDKDKFSLASLSINEVGAAKVGGIKATDFLYEGTGAKVSIGSMQVGAFDVPKSAKDPADDPKTAAPVTIGQTDFRDIAVDAAQDAPDPSKPATRLKFAIQHVGFAADAVEGNAPRKGSMALDHFTMDLLPDSWAQSLIDMGYTRLDVSGTSNSTYDVTAQTLAVKDVTVSGAGMGAVSLGFDLGNVSPSLFTSNTAAAKVAALAVLIKGLDLKIDNAGLLDKALDWQAKNEGTTPEAERGKITTAAQAQIPALLGNGANSKAIVAAVVKFIAAPKSLHISATSKTGLGMADMALIGTPDVLLDSLDVKATANE